MEGIEMSEELTKVEARQGDRQRGNLRVLVYSLVALLTIAFVASMMFGV